MHGLWTGPRWLCQQPVDNAAPQKPSSLKMRELLVLKWHVEGFHCITAKLLQEKELLGFKKKKERGWKTEFMLSWPVDMAGTW